MKMKTLCQVLGPALGMACAATAGAQTPAERASLPVPEGVRKTYTEIDARDAKMPPRADVKAPKGAPNVVIILIDDLGFGATSTFGGPIKTEALDRLAQNGLRYNNFHTTALSSPTRAALKSGRNHHTVNMAFITEMATGFPGATGPGPGRGRAARRDAAAQRLCDGRLRQVARDGRLGNQRRRPVRPLAARARASTSSTASSAARRTSGRRTCTTASRRSSCRTTRTTTS